MPFAILLSLAGTSMVRALAKKRSWYDDPNDPRKIHKGQIPRLGGVAMFWSFALTIMAAALVSTRGELASLTFVPALLLAFGIAHFTGLVDDFKNIRARHKLILQIAAAIVLMVAGFRFRTLPLPGTTIALGWFSYPLTLIWIVGVMNAVNMIDGMDGLAGGLAFLASISYGIIFLSIHNSGAALVAFTIAGAALGFLFHNFPPAKIFMGDSGSLFLGIAMATLPLLHRGTNPTTAGLIPGISLALIPIYDVFAAILRRSGRHVPVMSPDKEHLHHKLMSLGLDCRAVLVVVYAGELILACLVLAGIFIPYRIYFSLTILAWCLTLLGFGWLHFATDPQLRWEEYARLQAEMKARELEQIKDKEEEDRFKDAGA
jgi:UDP-GlcNAc:undecaprenyl-phosphate GlcNAc-1-phosphate transferase